MADQASRRDGGVERERIGVSRVTWLARELGARRVRQENGEKRFGGALRSGGGVAKAPSRPGY